MRRLPWITVVLLLSSPPTLMGRCIELPTGQTLRCNLSSARPGCFLVKIEKGDAARLLVEQPVDLAISVTGPRQFVADSFEFGFETATLAEPGNYTITLKPVEPTTKLLHLVMSASALPLQQALEWSAAEEMATRGKRNADAKQLLSALSLWNRLSDGSAAARTHLLLGDISFNRDREAALGHYEEGRRLCLEARDTRCAAEAENNGGLVSQRLGDFDTADRRLKEALDGWRSISDPLSQGRTLSNLGWLYWQSGDMQSAIAFFARARPLLQDRDPVGYAKVLNNLGLCYQSAAEFSTARNYFAQANAAFLRHASHRDAIRSRLNLGRNELLVRAASAIATLTAAESDAERSGDSAVVADARNNLGQALIDRGQPQQAQLKLEQALEIDTRLGDRRAMASDLHYLGVTAAALHDTVSAGDFLQRALEMRTDCRLRDDAADSLYELARLERDGHHTEAARNFAAQSLSLLESVRRQVPSAALRATFYARRHRLIDLQVGLALSEATPEAAEKALLASEQGRGRALLDILAARGYEGKGPDDLSTRRERIERRIDLLSGRLSTAQPEEMSALRREVERLVAAGNEIEALMHSREAPSGFGKPLESVGELRRAGLPSDSALLEFHLGELESYLWWVDAEHVQVYRLPRKAVIDTQAGRIVREFGDILPRRRDPSKRRAFDRALTRLSTTVLGPLKGTRLPARLIVVPDGSLHGVPFAALSMPSTGAKLGLTSDLLQVPAASYLTIGRIPRPFTDFPATALVVADPVLSPSDPRVTRIAARVSAETDSSFARLAFGAEITLLNNLLPSAKRMVLRSFSASRETLHSLPVQSFAMVLFSTHAVIDDQIPELSRVLLSSVDRAGRPIDGVLRPYQFGELRLEGSIVVLSACETALGKEVLGEGLAGFSSALFQAGAAQAVLTLTRVDAEASSEFLRRTFRQFLRSRGAGIEHAITVARRSMAFDARWSDPYYWASFVVAGRLGKTLNPRGGSEGGF